MRHRGVMVIAGMSSIVVAAAAACTSDDEGAPISFDAAIPTIDAASDRSIGANDSGTTDTGVLDTSASDATDANAGDSAPDAAPLLLVSGLQSVSELTVDGNNLFWFEGPQYQENTLRTCSIDGCVSPTTIATEAATTYLRYMAVSGSDVYYTTLDNFASARVVKATMGGDGGAGSTLVTDWPKQPYGIAVGPSGLYWVDYYEGDVVHCDPANCATTRKVIGNNGPRTFTLKLNASSAFWVGEGNPSSQSFVASCDLPECDAGVQRLMYPGHNARQIRLGSSDFYFLNLNDITSGYEVRTCPLGGCPDAGPASLVSSDLTKLAVNTLAVTGTDVYWLHDGKIVTCGVGGCDGGAANVHTVVTTSDAAAAEPTFVASDVNYIYYSTAGGEIWRVLR